MREKEIIKTGIIGIVGNVILAGMKAIIGIMAGSIAIILDAINNISDALSSVITIVGTRLAGRRPDKKHPLGYGRIEYLSGTVISLIVVYAGISSLKGSIEKIIEPSEPKYTFVSLIIIFIAIIVKLAMGFYVKKKGMKLNSNALIASGEDAKMDAVISASTFFAAIVYMKFGIALEAYLGVIISLFIIKTGWDILRDTVSQIIGERTDSTLVRDVKDTIDSFEEVYGTYDLILHSYGPNTIVGSCHIEVDYDMPASRLDELQRDITDKVYGENHVIMSGISVYSRNDKNSRTQNVLSEIRKIVMKKEHILQIHGFYLDEGEKEIRFDIVVDYDAPNREAIVNNIKEEVAEKFKGYTLRIAMDDNISD